jgi:predicted amidohydrolase
MKIRNFKVKGFKMSLSFCYDLFSLLPEDMS